MGVNKTDVGEADFQEELDILLEVSLSLEETEQRSCVMVVVGMDGVREEEGGEVAGGGDADVPAEEVQHNHLEGKEI